MWFKNLAQGLIAMDVTFLAYQKETKLLKWLNQIINKTQLQDKKHCLEGILYLNAMIVCVSDYNVLFSTKTESVRRVELALARSQSAKFELHLHRCAHLTWASGRVRGWQHSNCNTIFLNTWTFILFVCKHLWHFTYLAIKWLLGSG